jgi:hypothetical protein
MEDEACRRPRRGPVRQQHFSRCCKIPARYFLLVLVNGLVKERLNKAALVHPPPIDHGPGALPPERNWRPFGEIVRLHEGS